MKRSDLYYFVVFLFFAKTVDAQTIQGKVIDKKTRQVVAFVSIGIVDTNEAAITKENDFESTVNFFPLNIYRLENHLTNLPNDFKILELKSGIFTTITTFKPNGDAVRHIENIATKLSLTLRADKQPFNINVTSLLSVYRIDKDLKKQDFVSLNVNTKDKTVIESIRYNVEFWKGNSIVKQTALENSFIKMMDSKSAFGTMTNP